MNQEVISYIRIYISAADLKWHQVNFQCNLRFLYKKLISPVKFCHEIESVLNFVSHVPSWVLWVYFYCACLYRYFVGPKLFLMGISWVQKFSSRVFSGSTFFSRGYFVVRNFLSWAFLGCKFFCVGILWV